MTTGLLFGLLIGGVGGRLAMFVLRLTSDPGLKGVKTDDEFEIGRFSGDTLFLIAITAVIGTLVGALYLVARIWLPEKRRPLWAGLLAGLIGGAAIVHPGGVDFTQLDPLWLAIALFVIIPGLFGAAVSVVVERRLAGMSDGPGRMVWLAALPLVPLLLTGVLGLTVLLVLAACFVAQQRWPALTGVARSRAGMALGRAFLVAVGGLAAFDLVQDAADIL